MGVVRVAYLSSMAKITSGSSFEPNNWTEQKGGERLRVVESENDLEEKTRTPKSFNVSVCMSILNQNFSK